MFVAMSPRNPETSRESLLNAGTLCFRREGYVATTVDDICREAGVSKGAFFHHFASKEALAAACLEKWRTGMATMDAAAPYRTIADPVKRLIGCMEFYASILSEPSQLKSCLAGTIAQEVFDTNPKLRDASNNCFVGAEGMFAALLREAAEARGVDVDVDGLAKHWTGAIQGALILYKASQDVSVIRNNLNHVRDYIAALIRTETSQ